MSQYTDVEAILADETLIPVTWRTSSRGLGRALDPGADSDDIINGTQLDLPLWMIREVAKRHMVDLHLPGFFGHLMERRLRAGAAVEDLAGRCPHFYDVAQEMATLLPGVSNLPQLAASTFRIRYRDLLMQGLTRGEGTVASNAIQQRLSTEEAILFQAARVSVLEADRWNSSDVLSVHSRAPKRKLQPGAGPEKTALEPKRDWNKQPSN